MGDLGTRLRVLYLKSDIVPWLIIPLFYLFADVTQSHARCKDMNKSPRPPRARNLNSSCSPYFLGENVVSKPTEQRKRKN